MLNLHKYALLKAIPGVTVAHFVTSLSGQKQSVDAKPVDLNWLETHFQMFLSRFCR